MINAVAEDSIVLEDAAVEDCNAEDCVVDEAAALSAELAPAPEEIPEAPVDEPVLDDRGSAKTWFAMSLALSATALCQVWEKVVIQLI